MELDAYRLSKILRAMPTALDTAGLRELGPEVLARAVFSARACNAIYASKLKEVVDAMASGSMSEGQARTALYETLDALGYTPEGGFPDTPLGEVPPAIRGTLQDLRSFQRMNLVVRTQVDLTDGRGEQMRGHDAERIRTHPAWELVRLLSKEIPRDWPSRWTIAGGTLYEGRMIAPKGSPVWGELGNSGNFADALDVDHPPFAFHSGMGWREISALECRQLGVEENGLSAVEFVKTQPNTLAGKLPLPAPQISLNGVERELAEKFVASTGAARVPDKPGVYRHQALLDKALARAAATYAAQNGGAP